MKTFDANDFVSIIREGATPLSLADFHTTPQIGNLWDKLEPDDIRVTTLKTKEAFYDYCYDFIHDDGPLIEYFNKRLSYKDVKGVSVVPVIKKEIKHSPNNTRVIRNIHLDSVLNCTESDGMNLKVAYKTALEYSRVHIIKIMLHLLLQQKRLQDRYLFLVLLSIKHCSNKLTNMLMLRSRNY